ncbi:DUF2917 domain-containing protein [Myxococcus vastator]|uniref:DUF2917 domain-containing protein n=1 Tax=Myxococcus vastator TaxID=2709664 RepID=UPI001967D1A2
MWDWMRKVTKRRRRAPRPALNTGPVQLAQGTPWSVRTRGDEPLMLTCAEGTLWLTREGDARDYVLWPGDTLRLEHAGHVVVQALRPSRFCLTAQSPSRRTGEAGRS